MKDMLMNEYSVSKLFVKNSPTSRINSRADFGYKEEHVWDIEKYLSDEEKLEIIDYHTDGLGSYILDLIRNYQVVRENPEVLKRTTYGGFNKNSLLKWLNTADPRNVCSRILTRSYPTYWMFKKEFRLTEECPTTDYGYRFLYTDQPVVRQWFHDLLNKLNKEETEWFLLNDAHEVKINKVKDLADIVGTDNLNNRKLSDLVWNNKRDDFTDEELDHYIEVLSDIVNYINEKKAQLELI